MLHFSALLTLATLLLAVPPLDAAVSQRVECKSSPYDWQIPTIEDYHKDMKLKLDCEIVDLAGTVATVELTYPSSPDFVNATQYCRYSRRAANDAPSQETKQQTILDFLFRQMPKEAITGTAKNLGEGALYGCAQAAHAYAHLEHHGHYNLLCLYKKPTGEEQC